MVNKFIPKTLKEALEILSSHECTIVAGGSDMMVAKKNVAGLLPKFDKDVLFIANVKDLRGIKKESDGLHVGACVTLEEMLDSDLVPQIYKDVIVTVASPNIRHFATIAGNICNASPAGDTTVVDVLCDAKMKIESVDGVRYVAAEDFVKGVRKIDLNKNEMVSEMIIPNLDFTEAKWFKVGSRKADSISKLSFAGAVKIEDGILKDIRLCFGSVFIKVVRSHELENMMKGHKISELYPQISTILDKYSEIIHPIDDLRSNHVYRKTVAMNILKDFLEGVMSK